MDKVNPKDLKDIDWSKLPENVTAEMVTITPEKRKIMAECSARCVADCKRSGLSPIDAVFVMRLTADALAEQYGLAAMIMLGREPGKS